MGYYYPLKMGGIIDWFKRGIGKPSERARRTYDQIKGINSEIQYIESLNAFDTVKREERVLSELKKDVYDQDQKKIKESLTLFENLSSQQVEISEEIAGIKNRLAQISVRGYKKRIGSLIKKLEDAGKDYDNLVLQNRNYIEKIKASIKANDFQFAEVLINKSIELSDSLKARAREIDRYIGQLESIRQSIISIPGPRRTP